MKSGERTQFMAQQAFLEHAMQQLSMSREQFAAQLGTSLKGLERWLLPCSASDYHDLDEPVWRLVREMLRNRCAGRAGQPQ